MPSQRSSPVLTLPVLVLSLLAVPLGAQTLYGVGTSTVLDFTSIPAGPCPAPTNDDTSCIFQPPPCGPALTALPPAFLFDVGDIAADRLRDTYFVTDGATITEFQGRAPCDVSGLCQPIGSFGMAQLPALGLGPLTGMGMDEQGTLTGGRRTLWITDGLFIAGIEPLGCATPKLLVAPFSPVLIDPIEVLTDVTWDPSTSTLWACTNLRRVLNIAPGSGTVLTALIAPGAVDSKLKGIAFDLGTPDPITGEGASMYVADRARVIRMNTLGVETTSFAQPVNGYVVPLQMSGLAFAAHAIQYGTPDGTTVLRATGSTTSPQFSVLALELDTAPPGLTVFLALNVNVPGPGKLCPPLTGLTTTFYVDPSPPGLLLPVSTTTGGCQPLGSLLIPDGVPPGVEAYLQVLLVAPGAQVVQESTNGLALRIVVP